VSRDPAAQMKCQSPENIFRPASISALVNSVIAPSYNGSGESKQNGRDDCPAINVIAW
jgi:hypothetical protein